jgi:hypothetical protein
LSLAGLVDNPVWDPFEGSLLACVGADSSDPLQTGLYRNESGPPLGMFINNFLISAEL